MKTSTTFTKPSQPSTPTPIAKKSSHQQKPSEVVLEVPAHLLESPKNNTKTTSSRNTDKKMKVATDTPTDSLSFRDTDDKTPTLTPKVLKTPKSMLGKANS
jgi:hypothetical protein